MNVYWLIEKRRYVRTQGETKGQGPWEKREIDTAQPALIAFLNELLEQQDQALSATETVAHAAAMVEPAEDVAALHAQIAKLREDLRKVGAAYRELQAKAIPAAAPPPPPAEPGAPKSMGAEAVLSRMDNPGTDVDAIVETICKSKGYALKRFAGAVAVAFQSLSGK